MSSLVAAVIDPVLVGTGFGPRQDGRPPEPGAAGVAETTSESPWPVRSASLLWCAAYDDLQVREPRLPQGYTLSKTFEAVGESDDAQVAAGLIGSPAESACPTLTDLLARLLDTTRGC